MERTPGARGQPQQSIRENESSTAGFFSIPESWDLGTPLGCSVNEASAIPASAGSPAGADYEAVRQEMERLTRKVSVGAQGGPVLLNGVEYEAVPLAQFQLRMQRLLQRFRATLQCPELQRGLESRGYIHDWDIGVDDLRVPQMEALVEDTFEKRFRRDRNPMGQPCAASSDPTGQPCSAPGQAQGDRSSARDPAPAAHVPSPMPGPAYGPPPPPDSTALPAMAPGLEGTVGAERGSMEGPACGFPAESPFAGRPEAEVTAGDGAAVTEGTPLGGEAAQGPTAVGGARQGVGAEEQGSGEKERLMTRTVDQLVQQARARERALQAAPLLCLRELQQAEEERKRGRHKKKKGEGGTDEETEQDEGVEDEEGEREELTGGASGTGPLGGPAAALRSSRGTAGRGGRAKQAQSSGEGPGRGRGPGWRQMWERLEDPRKSHVPNLVYSRIKRALEAHEGEWAPVEVQDLVLRIEFLYPDPGPHYRKGQEFLVLGSQVLTELRDRIYCIHDTNARDHNMLVPSAFFCIEDVFYDDMRSPEAVEYSKTFLEWNQRKRQEGEASAQHAGRRPFSALGLGSGALRKRPRASPAPALPVYSCGRMEGTRFRDLSIRPGALYVYFHQGGCKHAFKVTDVHLLHPQDCDNAMAYPLLTHEPRYSVRKCMVCDVAGSTKVVYRDRLATTDPAFYCTSCYHSLHYSGNKLLYSDFKVFNYYHE